MELTSKHLRARKSYAFTLTVALLFALVTTVSQSQNFRADISTTELNILDDVKPELTQKTSDAKNLIQKNSETLTTDSTDFTSEIPKDSENSLMLGNSDPAKNSDQAREELRYFNHGARIVNGTFSANKIIYADIWPHTDLLVTMLENGVKEDIILKNNQAPLSFEYLVETVGLRLELTTDGGYEFLDRNGQKKFYTPAPDLTDTTGQKITTGVYYDLAWGEDTEVETVEASADVLVEETVVPVEETSTALTEEVVESVKVVRPRAIVPVETETSATEEIEITPAEEVPETTPTEEVVESEETLVEEIVPTETAPTEEISELAEEVAEDSVEEITVVEEAETILVEEVLTEEVPSEEVVEMTEEISTEEVEEAPTEEVPAEETPTEEVETTPVEETPTEELVETPTEEVVETPAEEAITESEPIAFFQKFLPKFLRASLLETGRQDFENSIQSF
ncbi:hypothetical protein K9M43_02565, partial [Candidatus Gracilibacteria bacterium]|nr:hypothetical protein [Candidatus Gracilibacteria bacterium]